MYPLSTAAQNVIASSHRITVRATAYGPTGGGLVVPISGGSVVCDARSQTRRTAQVEVADPKLWPDNPLDVLSPYGAELALDYGLVLSDGTTEWIPLGRFALTENSRSQPTTGGGALSLQLADRSRVVADDRFTTTQQTRSGATVVAEITRLIQDTLGSVAVVDRTGSTKVAPLLEIAKERWSDGVEALATAIAAEVYADPVGDFVIRPQPTLADPVVWRVPRGARGILISRSDKLLREAAWNQWVVSGQRSDGTSPVYAVTTDDDPDSPTLFRTGFKRTRYYSSPLLTTVAECQAAGASLLARYKGGGAQVSLQALVNPALEAGDVIGVPRAGGDDEVYIVDRVTVPLGPGGVQQIDTRGLTIPAEQ